MRRALMAIAVLLMAGGVTLLITGQRAPGSNLLVTGSVLLVVLVFERWRYRGPAGGGRWRATDERFEDPESGEVIEVQFDPATGQRRYVKATGQPPRTEPR